MEPDMPESDLAAELQRFLADPAVAVMAPEQRMKEWERRAAKIHQGKPRVTKLVAELRRFLAAQENEALPAEEWHRRWDRIAAKVLRGEPLLDAASRRKYVPPPPSDATASPPSGMSRRAYFIAGVVLWLLGIVVFGFSPKRSHWPLMAFVLFWLASQQFGTALTSAQFRRIMAKPFASWNDEEKRLAETEHARLDWVRYGMYAFEALVVLLWYSVA